MYSFEVKFRMAKEVFVAVGLGDVINIIFDQWSFGESGSLKEGATYNRIDKCFESVIHPVIVNTGSVFKRVWSSEDVSDGI